MAHIKPFCAVRPNANIASEFSSLSVQSYSKEELDDLLKNNPYSFVQILKSSLIKHEDKSLEERYKSVKKTYQNFKNKGHLIQDSFPAFYIYEIEDQKNTYF